MFGISFCITCYDSVEIRIHPQLLHGMWIILSKRIWKDIIPVKYSTVLGDYLNIFLNISNKY